MNYEFISKILIFFGLGLFLSTLTLFLDIPLKNTIVLSVGFGCIVGGLMGLIETKTKYDHQNTNDDNI